MSLGSGIRNKPIPDPGSRGQKGPNPGSATPMGTSDFDTISKRNVYCSMMGTSDFDTIS